MKDDLTPEQKERLQQQDEFLGAVNGAVEGDKKQQRLMKKVSYKKKGKMKYLPGFKDLNAEGKAREKNVDVNKLEKIYQQNRQDLNDENVPAVDNPKWQSPRSDQYKNPVNEAIKTGGIKVKKILGK